ncbi:immunoglobulin alpha Fc receptor-like [Gracilinanus agilis]|uniref:immunoglobulin alpha Fc receptor-like n=1 Tax=Gracilinanus agilis TaxID=191870 RepID=UPI001CFF505E|nr:immunoglobulin alpha Fc receptor-like [Gracilinanus agilis]
MDCLHIFKDKTSKSFFNDVGGTCGMRWQLLIWDLTHLDLSLIGLYLSHRIQAQEGSLPKATLSADRDLIMAPGSNLTLKCKKPDSEDLVPQQWTYLLLKEGNSQPLKSHTSVGSWAKFSLPWVTAQDSGNYSCKYFGSQDPQRESEASSALEIWVKASGSTTLLMIFSCAIMLFFLFLLAFLCHHRYCFGEFRRRMYSTQWTSGADDYRGVTYSQLNIKTLSKGRQVLKENEIYSTVAQH